MKIGIDVGGSHIGLGIVDKTGKLILKKEKDYEKTESNMSQIVLDTIKKLIYQVLNEKQITIKEIESIGMAFPGTVSNGVVIKAENLGIENLKIEQELKKEFNVKIYLENDAKCAAIAEKEYGSLKKYEDSLFVIIGTGVGGAAILNSKLLRPKRNSGFEFGHMVIKKDGEKCNCGRNGCFEVYGSMKRFKLKIKEIFNLPSIDGKMIRQFMIENQNNEDLNKIIDEYIENIVLGFANLINIFEPQAISIGGSFGHYKDLLLPKLVKKLEEKTEVYNKEDIPKILIAELKNDAGIIGAAMQI